MMIFVCPGLAEMSSSPGFDQSFNTPNGYTLWHTPGASQDRALEMAIQGDGKILLGGYTNDTKQKDIQILRYLPNGTPDHSFGNGGQIVFSGGAGKDDYAFGIALDANEKILVTGREHNGKDSDLLLLRCNPDGTPDNTFGENGTVRYAGSGDATDSGRGIVVQKDGKIVVCGEVNVSSHKELAVLRFTPDGLPDPGFASAGVFTLGAGEGNESYGFGTALDQEERIVITGGISQAGKEGIGLVRVNSNGTIDTSFGKDGLVIWHGTQGGPDYGNWVSITRDGKILITGVETDTSGSFDIVLLRYNQDGTPDFSFGDEGVVRFAKSGYDYAWSQTILDDGRIVIAGTSVVNGLESPVLIGFSPDGQPDSAFGKGGIQSFETIGIGPLYAVHSIPEGKILAAGYILEEDTDLLVLIRIPAP